MDIYKPGFVYSIEHLDKDGAIKSVELVENIIPTVGLDYLLGAAFKGTSQFTAWYLGLFGAAHTPIAGDTMTTLLSDCAEIVSYTGTTRQDITFPAVSVGALVTTATPNVFAFASGATVRGAFITSNPTWSNTSGLLVSEILFLSPKVLAAGESLRVPLGFSLVSV